MSFIVYDLIFLVVFVLVAGILLYRDKKNVKRQGIMILYHSKFGVKFIDRFAKRFEKILKPMQYLVVTSGYILMVSIVWLIVVSVYKYVTSPIPRELQNVPPIAPLIPYFPALFNLESIFPPLYFTYFIIALAIVALSHEFAHGIFMRLNKIDVKTTGLAFLGPFFGAFVEPDEKQMNKSKKFPQLAVLAAGTFANVVMTVVFLGILAVFFMFSFSPAGVNFNAYPQAVVNVDNIDSVNGILFSDIENISAVANEDLNEISVGDNKYLVPRGSLELSEATGNSQIVVFEDAPAVREGIHSPIVEIANERVTSRAELSARLADFSPGERIEVVILEDGKRVVKNIELGDRNGNAYLGVGFIEPQNNNVVSSLIGIYYSIKDPLVYYEPSWDGDFVVFIFDLLWWIVVINVLVALFNMLPVSILDGGRFFYLTVWGITGKEKIGIFAYKAATWAILGLLVLMTVRWVFVFF